MAAASVAVSAAVGSPRQAGAGLGTGAGARRPAQCSSRAGDDASTIISPNRATLYSLRLSKPAPLALRANAMAAADTLYWFANGGLIGKGPAGEALAWTPQVAGRTVLRVVDQHGRADSRDIDVEFVP